jgi:hypothetical protein
MLINSLFVITFWRTEKISTFALTQKEAGIHGLKSEIIPGKYQSGDVAQLVEQRTENPCVSGSIPLITTIVSAFNRIDEKRRNTY